jgi:hypothetical protein
MKYCVGELEIEFMQEPTDLDDIADVEEELVRQALPRCSM